MLRGAARSRGVTHTWGSADSQGQEETYEEEEAIASGELKQAVDERKGIFRKVFHEVPRLRGRTGAGRQAGAGATVWM